MNNVRTFQYFIIKIEELLYYMLIFFSETFFNNIIQYIVQQKFLLIYIQILHKIEYNSIGLFEEIDEKNQSF